MADSDCYSPPFFDTLQPFLGQHPCVLLVRHAERFPISADASLDAAMACSLTETGRRQARAFGSLLARDHSHLCPEIVVSSPVQRCVETAEQILQGAGWNVKIEKNVELTCVHLVDSEMTPQIIKNPSKIMYGMVTGTIPFGQHTVDTAAANLMRVFWDSGLSRLSAAPRSFGIVALHDLNLAFLMGAYFKGRSLLTESNMPEFLEGALVQRISDTQTRLICRGGAISELIDMST